VNTYSLKKLKRLIDWKFQNVSNRSFFLSINIRIIVEIGNGKNIV
jgi:hypothetical protein